jgi:hypothetical protein
VTIDADAGGDLEPARRFRRIMSGDATPQPPLPPGLRKTKPLSRWFRAHAPVARLHINEASGSPLSEGLDLTIIREELRLSHIREVHYARYREMLRDGTFAVRSPFDAASVSTIGSFPVMRISEERQRVTIFYLFRDQEPFFALADEHYGTIGGFYFPLRNVYIYDKLSRCTKNIGLLQAMIVKFYPQYEAYVSSRTTGVAVGWGMSNHLGHCVLNEYDMMTKVVEEASLNNVRLVIDAGAAFTSPPSLLPELAEIPVVTANTPDSLFITAVTSGLLTTRIAVPNYFVGASLQRRIEAAAADAVIPGSSQHARLEAAKQRSPLVWFEIRGKDLLWSDQISGTASIIQKLREVYPNLGVVIAGWSFLNDGQNTDHDLLMVDNDLKVAEDIRAIVGDDGVFLTVGDTTLEKFAWAFACDAYLSSFGSGLTFPLFAAARPGVVHTNEVWYNVLIGGMFHPADMISQETDLRLLAPQTRALPAGTQSGANDNFHSDWRIVLEALSDVLRSAHARHAH